MNIIRYLFYLILIILNKEVLLGGSFSLDEFINFLNAKGYYNLIQTTKKYLEDDAAIRLCIRLTKEKYYCYKVVHDYMGSKQNDDKCLFEKKIYDEVIFNYLKNKIITEKMGKLIDIILCYYNDLKKNMTSEEIVDLIERSIMELE